VSEINKHLVREPTAFGLLDRLATSELWEFTELDAAQIMFRPFERIYVENPSQVQAHPSFPELRDVCVLIKTGGWPGVWQALWQDKRLDGEFCVFALSCQSQTKQD
jgi:hypothetical protein